ncbi:MAG: D-alanyl-D-alanine carboxypeptidase/D-alanyl-D-alanine-endopeptidase, partial [Verrucomicrobiales bacterium]|nr:D-alanyl-D-alanine carboxypeptidase/D-alanyl-D-alanine-endopeptidase [Verrucomicrobiales bacterium]
MIPGHRFRARSLAAAATSLLVACATGLFGPATLGADSLDDSLRRFVEQPEFARATWGVSVQDADTGRVRFETNGHRLLKPASNAKLFTGALALHALGPRFHLSTDLVPTGPVSPQGTLHGDLLVRGFGDFSLADRFPVSGSTSAIHRVVQLMRAAGLRRIDGDLVADDSWFRGPSYGSGWTADDRLYDYGAEVSALSLNDNVLALEIAPGAAEGDSVRVAATEGTSYFRIEARGLVTSKPGTVRTLRVRRGENPRHLEISGALPVGSEPWKELVPVPEPARFFVHCLREALIEAGIRVQGKARRATDATGVPVPRGGAPAPISVVSPPLADLVAGMMKPSQNLYAQLLLLQVGARSRHAANPSAPALDTEEAGILALRDFVEEAGLPVSEVRLDDGSGLSRSSLVTPAAIVALLRYMDRHPLRDAFLATLPVAGRDGTLRRRLVGTPLEGNLRAKTGSLRYVHTLSGFLVHPSG